MKTITPNLFWIPCASICCVISFLEPEVNSPPPIGWAYNFSVINLHDALKNPRGVSQYHLSCPVQCRENPSSLKNHLRGYFLTPQPHHEISQHPSPLNRRTSHRQLVCSQSISTPRTLKSFSPYFPMLGIVTLWTSLILLATILYCRWLKWYLTLSLFLLKNPT